MKKVLSLVLALMMVVGMSTVAFAATGDVSGTGTAAAVAVKVEQGATETVIVTIPQYVELANGTTDIIASNASATGLPYGVTLGTVKVLSDGSQKIGTPYFSQKISIELIAAADAPVVSAKAATVATGTTGTNTSISIPLNVTVAEPTVTPPTPGPVTTVPTSDKITGFAPGAAFVTPAALSAANQESKLKITADMFTWESGTKYDASAKMRASHLKDIGVRRVYQKGTANTIRDVELRTSDFDVRVRTVKFYTLTKETDVELKVALTYKGSTKGAPEYEYNFTIANDEELIEEGQTEAYSFGNVYLKADATVRNVTFQGDEDGIVYATKTVVKGQKYYFNVDTDLSDADKEIIENNPEVDSIYTVYQNNMANATVQFKNLDREFFVYDGEGKLLGTTKDSKLPLAKKYILTTAKVNFGGAEEEPVEEPVEEPTEPEAPPMGGGEVEAPVNNYNPNTGL